MDAAFCDALPSKAREQLGGLDIVINNAGSSDGVRCPTRPMTTTLPLSPSMSRPLFAFVGQPSLLAEAGGGAIVNIASCWGVILALIIRSIACPRRRSHR